MKKWFFIVAAVLVIGFVGYELYGSKSNAQPAYAQKARTATVQKGKLEVKISGSGTVQPVTSEDIKSNIANNEIDEVLVSEGETVSKGEPLITFTDGSDPVYAPADGIITSLSVAAGERVTSGEVVAHVTNYNQLQTVVQVDELDISKVKINQPVTVKVNAFPDKTYAGKVTAIANEGTSTNGISTFDVTVHINDITNLKVGMSTEASIVTASKDNALYVPVEAVHIKNDKKYVNVADSANTSNQSDQNSSGKQKIVKTGLANEDYVEITEGLTEGVTVRLPQLAVKTNTNTSTQNSQGAISAFGGMGGARQQFRMMNGGNSQFGSSAGSRPVTNESTN